MTKTNIVMLAKDRVGLTRQTLESLISHTHPDSYNLTIIDDQSETPVHTAFYEELRQLEGRVTVLRNDISKGITGQVRNLGVYWAERYWGRGDWLYLTDNDVYFTYDWLPNLILSFQEILGVGIPLELLGGGCHPYLRPNGRIRSTGHVAFPGGYGDREPIPLGVHYYTHDAIPGYTQLMRWKTWDQYGPLDAHAQGVGKGEDWKMCQDIIREGGFVASVWPELVYACGLTQTQGDPAPGSDIMPRYDGILQK